MKSRAGLGAAWAWGVIGSVACASVANLEPNMLEEGLPLHVAQRLLQGDHLYRDVVFFTGPLPFEFLALLFRCFGEHLVVARAAVVVLQGIATAAVFGIARRAETGVFAHVAAAVQASVPILVFPLFSIYFPSTLAAVLSTLAVYAAVESTMSLPWAVSAGVLAACVALCKQTVGVALALPLVVGVIAYAEPGRRLRTGGATVAGGVLVALVTVSAFAAQGTAGDLFESLVTMPLTLGESFRTPFPALWPPGDIGKEAWSNWPYYLPRLYVFAVGENPTSVRGMGFVTQVLYAAPFVALVATALRAGFGRSTAAAVLPVAAVIACTAGMFPRSDWGHLGMVLPAAWVQLVLVASAGRSPAGLQESRARRVAARSIVAGLAAAAVAAAALYYSVAAPQPWDARIPVRPVSESYRTPAVPRVIEYLRARTRPGEAVFVARQEPLLYFSTGARNPTRYEGMMQGIHERQQAEILEALASLRYVVMSEIDGPATGYYSAELPEVHAYLERYFRIPADFPIDSNQWIVVYERGVDRGNPVIDLVAAAPGARHWVVDPSGRSSEYPVSSLPIGAERHLRQPIPVPVGPGGGGVDFEIDVPERARFQTDVGIFAVATTKGAWNRWWGATYSVSVVRGDTSERVIEVPLPPDPDGVGDWQPIDLDLSRWGGQRVVLRLQVDPDKVRNRVRVGWWGSPRIVVSDAAPRTP